MEWSGAGTTVVEGTTTLDNEECDEENSPYLQWVLVDSKAKDAEISIDGADGVSMEKEKGKKGDRLVYTMTGPFDLDSIEAVATFANASKKAELTIESGCPGSDGPPPPPEGTCYSGEGQPDISVEVIDGAYVEIVEFGTDDGSCEGEPAGGTVGVQAESESAALQLCVESGGDFGGPYNSVRQLSLEYDAPDSLWECGKDGGSTCYAPAPGTPAGDLAVVGTLGTLGNAAIYESYDGTCTGDEPIALTVINAADSGAASSICTGLYPSGAVLVPSIYWQGMPPTWWACYPTGP